MQASGACFISSIFFICLFGLNQVLLDEVLLFLLPYFFALTGNYIPVRTRVGKNYNNYISVGT
jgi:hypothetical protein